MTIYYHISSDLNHTGEFTPRIPEQRSEEEDSTTPRISVSPSINEALSSIPGGGSDLDQLLYTLNPMRNLFKIFEIDTEILGISSDNVIPSKELFEKGLVPDAEHTEESWILESFSVPKEYQSIIQIKDWDEEPLDIIPHYIYELAESKYDGDYIECYMKELNANVPSMIGITDVVVKSMLLQAGETFEIDINDEYDNYAMFWKLALDKLPMTVDIDEFQIIATALEDIDLSPVSQDIQVKIEQSI